MEQCSSNEGKEDTLIHLLDPVTMSLETQYRSYICSSLRCIFLALFVHSKTGDEPILIFGMWYWYEYTMKKMQKKILISRAVYGS